MLRTILSFITVLVFSVNTGFSTQTARNFGLRENTPEVFAIINASITVAPGEVLNNAVMVVRDGYIEAIGANADIPADASIIDMHGKNIYPGFIDAYSHYGIPSPGNNEGHHHWNPHIRSHISSASEFATDAEEAARLRSQGFVLAHTLPPHGLLSGSGSVVSLGEKEARYQIIKPDISQHMTFRISSEFESNYPTSLMGAVALMRQTMLDSEWYDAAREAFDSGAITERPEKNLSLRQLAQARKGHVPFVAAVEDENWFFRAAELAGEFELNLWIRGSGKEYRRLNALRGVDVPVILPLNFPEAPDVKTPEQSVNVSLEELRHWYLAPENPAKVIEAGLTTVFTSYGSDNDFLKNLRLAVRRGLPEEDALAAITLTPAELLGVEKQYGSLQTGKRASFVVSDGGLFEHDSAIREVWVEGIRFPKGPQEDLPTGKWMVQSPGFIDGAEIRIEGNQRRLRGEISQNDMSADLLNVSWDQSRLSMAFAGDSLGNTGHFRLSAHVSDDRMIGVGSGSEDAFISWKATRTSHPEERVTEPEVIPELEIPRRYPSMEYGMSEIPEQPAHVVVRGATLWTQGPEGILENADMLISDGVIAEIGHDIDAPRRAIEIDAGGKHVTPGLIDPHIHTSIAGGVNETGDAITSETRITDVMHADNVWIYRLLAGGITSASLLHGSANPIGGQNAVIKPRWGQLPGDLLIEDAAPGLKFALGENVKRMRERYPGSRQGVEQIIKDAFEAALAYGVRWERWENSGEGVPPRRDLQLEAILEVLTGERKAHVHAYRQDEMLMMMRLAEQYGFTVGSFEHTLEGYKIADELREHGAGAVVWTDWSSFKVEAYDGILYNARLLNEAGVLTSLHSDNTQLATRMNWEAAKIMMTGMDEEDALDLITLRPAKILGIDHRVGSLEAGKDADFVIWNGHPMSTFTVALQTWVDGRKYFDREQDKIHREQVRSERALIIEALLEMVQN